MNPMLRAALLGYAHVSAILLLTVFVSAQTAVLNAAQHAPGDALLRRLLRLDAWLWGSFAAVFATGAAHVFLGLRAWQSFAFDALLWGKLALFAAMLAMAVAASRTLRRWQRRGATPFADTAELRAQRRWLMWQAHLMVVLPLLGMLLAHGY